MISIKTTDGKVIKSVTSEEAESIINSASPNDLYFVHDSSLNPPWKKQSWCDHNIFGFSPGPTCTVYSINSLKESLKFYNEVNSDWMNIQ